MVLVPPSVISLSLWEDLVAGEGVVLGVVGADTVWVAQGLEGGVVMLLLVLQEVLHISVGEVSNKTGLHVLDFDRDSLVVVVGGGVGDPAVIKS